MSDMIEIPVQDLSRIFDEIKLLKNEIIEASGKYNKALEILNNPENYTGGASDFLSTANMSMIANLDKLSQYYQSCYVYILNVMNTFVGVDEEITKKLYYEFIELKLIE